MMKFTTCLSLFLLGGTLIACNNDDKKDGQANGDDKKTAMITEEKITYSDGSASLNGYVAYDSNTTEKRPAVLVVHEWWGQNDYVRNRAKQLARMGYVAMAVDMFGDGKTAANPEEAQALTGPFYQDPQLAKSRLEAALTELKKQPNVDTSRIAAIGYCFGGTVVLNAARFGADLDGVVSFHGSLPTDGAFDKNLWKAKTLVCHGGADPFVPQAQVDAFNKKMDSLGVDYTFKAYPNSTHAFTNPDATDNGKKFNLPIAYNAAADTASWNDMKAFFGKIF